MKADSEEARSRTTPMRVRCPQCGFEMGARALEGLCPRCLLGRALQLSAALPEPDADVPEGPVLFGAYELGAKLGEGGMGVVYEARQAHTGRLVALKRIRDGELAGAVAQRRFFEEAAVAARLDHPHIVPLYDVGMHEGQPYFTMKLMAGGTLAGAADRLREPRRAAALVATLARTVHEGHRQGIVHRDLKPENILFDERGEPHVADFGVAKYLGEDGSTKSGAVVGTLFYMAPEQGQGQAKRATAAADVWSLGVILYELLAGGRPFAGPTPVEVLRRTLEEEPEPLRSLRRDIDRDLETVCLTCLRKEPEARYSSAEALAEDLARYVAGEPVEARRIGLAERWRRRAARYPLIAGMAGLLFVAVVYAVVTTMMLIRTRFAQHAALHAADLAARQTARAVAAVFAPYKAEVQAAAKDPEIARVVADPSWGSAFCARLLGDRAASGVVCYIDDTEGRMIGRAPTATAHDTVGLSYAFRDYFRGSKERDAQGRDDAYVSRVYLSEGDNRLEVGVSVPLYDSGRWAGVLVIGLPIDFAIAAIERTAPGGERFTVRLLTPSALERNEEVTKPDQVFVLSPAHAGGTAPLAGPDDLGAAGSRMNAFELHVPVEGTPFSVLVQFTFDGPLADD